MRIVLQKVKNANVKINDKTVGQIAHGFLLLLAIKKGDTKAQADYLVDKICKLRLFSDAGSDSFMEKNILEVLGSVLVVSQFTLYGDCQKGTRPSFTESEEPVKAKEMYEYFVEKMKANIKRVETGRFAEHMEVSLVNDGPITLILEK
ncbi:MAG: D-aminoacyl-tRNA deacylase [Patescibacteria group bacterium]|nr:D-aminoacyl-tRNA deacylase [Patescibacteria group bacterium]